MSVTKKTILIVGDSWPSKVWYDNDDDLKVTDSGIANLLSNDFNIINLSHPGSSNQLMLNNLSAFLIGNANTFVDVDAIIVFPSEITRQWHNWSELFKYTNKKMFDSEKIMEYAGNLKNLEELLLTGFYDSLNNLANKFKTPLYLIGGCSDILKGYNDNVLCESWSKLLLKEDNSVYSFYHNEQQVESLLLSYNRWFNNKDYLMNTLDKAHGRFEKMKNDKIHYSDSYHPSLQSHQILYDFLSETGAINKLSI